MVRLFAAERSARDAEAARVAEIARGVETVMIDRTAMDAESARTTRLARVIEAAGSFKMTQGWLMLLTVGPS